MPILFWKKQKGPKSLEEKGPKSLEDYIQKVKQEGKDTVFLAAYKSDKPYSVGDLSDFGMMTAMIGLTTDCKKCYEKDTVHIKYLEYQVKVCDFHVLDAASGPEYFKQILQSIDEKTREIILCLEKNGLKGVKYYE
jgi:hypothetical protein